jgi:cytochrome c-type biogenesis protein CcmH
MHRDVLQLVAGGYSATQILSAFRAIYGERVLMSPPRVGFNLLGYIMPFVALAGGATAVAVVLRNWRARAQSVPAAGAIAPVDASADEIARITAAMRTDK